MKRIINIIVLMIICFLPIMVEAKLKYEFDWNVDDKFFLHKENDIYYFGDNLDFSDYSSIYTYDNEGQIIKEENLFDLEGGTEIDDKYIKIFKSYFRYKALELNQDIFFDEVNNHLFYLNYNEEVISVEGMGYDLDNVVSFDNYLDLNNNYVNKKIELYNLFKDKLPNIFIIDIFENSYVIYYRNNYSIDAYILDSNYELIFDHRSKFYNELFINEVDGLIYLVNSEYVLEIYKLDGTLVDEIPIESDYFDRDKYGYCGGYNFAFFQMFDNELFMTYSFSTCPHRMDYDDESDFVKLAPGYPGSFTAKYSLEYEIDKVESNNGDFTYVEKVDEDGKSYVELKITPKNGYIVDKIIVTDTNGNKIEVTDNKFYKPLNDIKIEVQYKIAGEYVPMPDTFLGKSLTLIMIGFILIGLGVYTVNYIKN